MTAPTVSIAIIGAGISGLSLAALLAAREIPFLLFEQSQPSAFQGYGITLRSWAVKPFLASLSSTTRSHYSAPTLQSAVCVDAAIGGSGHISPSVRDGTSAAGTVLTRPEGGSEGEFFRASRRRLRQWLLDRLPADSVKWACEVQIERSRDFENLDGEQSSVPAWSIISIATGSEMCRASLIIAADGINSATRRTLAENAISQLIDDQGRDSIDQDDTQHLASALSSRFSAQPMSKGAAVFNGQRTVPRAIYDKELAVYMQDSTLAMAALHGACLSLSLTDISLETATVSWTWSESDNSADVGDKECESGNKETCKSNSTATSSSLPATATNTHLSNNQIIAHITQRLRATSVAEPFLSWLSPANLAEKDLLYHWPMRSIRLSRADLSLLSSAESKDSTGNGNSNSNKNNNIILIGDAAHAMPIFAGEGGNHAILDAVELVRCLETSPEFQAAIGVGPGIDSANGTNGIEDIPRAFYDMAHPRWTDAIHRAEERAGKLHMPLDKWRALAGMERSG